MTSNGYVDIHCHILPGVDDGSQSLEESLEMVRHAESQGTSVIVASFHAGVELLDAVAYLPLIQKLNEAISSEGLDLTIVPGSEVIAGFMPENPREFTLNGSRYLLIEFSSSHLPIQADAMLRAYQERGVVPVIAHPERNPTILRQPEKLFRLLETSEALVQMTADSIAGTFGQEIAACSRYLLKKGAVDIIASDAHDPDYRTTGLKAGLVAAGKIVGEEEAMRMAGEYPRRLIDDLPWEPRLPAAPPAKSAKRSFFPWHFGRSQG